MKRIKKLQLCWFLLLPGLLLSAVLWENLWFLVLLLALLLLPLLFWIADRCSAGHIQLWIELPVNAGKNDSIQARLHLKSSSALPVCCLSCAVEAENLLNGGKEKISLCTSLMPREEKSLPLELKSQYCGRIQLQIRQAVLYDCFGLLPVKSPATANAAVTVQPATFYPELTVTADPNCPDDSETYSQLRPGYDMTETFQIRDYQEGDSIRQVHWKLSNKFDRLIIRDPSLPVTRRVLLLWERTQAENAVPAETDAQAEVLVSLAQALLEQAVSFYIAWNQAETGLCVQQEVKDMEDMVGLLPQLMAARQSQNGCSGAESFLRTAGEASYSHIVYLTGDLGREALGLQQLGRVTVLLCGEQIKCDTGAAEVRCFGPENYESALLELAI